MQQKKIAIVATAAAFLVAAIAVGYYFASPFVAANSLRTAAVAGDRDALSRKVDFPAVRDGLKSDLTAVMLQSFENDPQLRDNPFAGFALAMAPMIVNSAIDAYVTPEALAAMVASGKAQPTATPAQKTDAKAQAQQGGAKPHYAYQGLDTFRVTVTPDDGRTDAAPTFILRRQGLYDWRLVRIELPAGALKPA